MATVELDQLTVGSRGTTRLSEVTMAIPDGAFVGVIGASGSGKSTLLRAIAGLEPIVGGRLRLGARDVTRATPGERNVAMVFQDPALIGHLSGRRNVSFPLDVRRLDADDIRQRVDAEVRALRIEALMDREPSTLSKGEQQMIQIARALVRVPSVLLLDEPFAALDENLRRRMRSEIGMLQDGYGVTTVMTTNDSADLDVLTSMVAVLDRGRLVQWDTTAAVRRTPATLLAAAATGPLAMIETTVVADSQGFWLVREDRAGGEPVRVRAWSPALAAHVGTRVVMAVRPEDLVVTATGAVPARIERPAPLEGGGVVCTVAGVRLVATAPTGAWPSPGDQVRLRIDRYSLFDRSTDAVIV